MNRLDKEKLIRECEESPLDFESDPASYLRDMHHMAGSLDFDTAVPNYGTNNEGTVETNLGIADTMKYLSDAYFRAAKTLTIDCLSEDEPHFDEIAFRGDSLSFPIAYLWQQALEDGVKACLAMGKADLPYQGLPFDKTHLFLKSCDSLEGMIVALLPEQSRNASLKALEVLRIQAKDFDSTFPFDGEGSPRYSVNSTGRYFPLYPKQENIYISLEDLFRNLCITERSIGFIYFALESAIHEKKRDKLNANANLQLLRDYLPALEKTRNVLLSLSIDHHSFLVPEAMARLKTLLPEKEAEIAYGTCQYLKSEDGETDVVEKWLSESIEKESKSIPLSLVYRRLVEFLWTDDFLREGIRRIQKTLDKKEKILVPKA